MSDSCTFYQRIHRLTLEKCNDAMTNPDAVSQALGQGKGLIMENRGILLVGATIECPISYYIRMESLCLIQLTAEAAARGRGGDLVHVGDDEVKVSLYDM